MKITPIEPMISPRKVITVLTLAFMTGCGGSLPMTLDTQTPVGSPAIRSTSTPRLLPTAIPSESVTTHTVDATPTSPASGEFQATVTPQSPRGFIDLPWGVGDAGNWFLYATSVLTLTWIDPPLLCDQYDFVISESPSEQTVIGTDLDASDGVSIEWQVPERISEASLRGEAFCGDSSVISSFGSGILYSGDAPPEGVCVLASGTIGAIDVLHEPSLSSEPFAFLVPGVFAPVLERTQDGWYRVDANVATLMVDESSAPETGWITDRYSIKLFGPCDTIPFVGNLLRVASFKIIHL